MADPVLTRLEFATASFRLCSDDDIEEEEDDIEEEEDDIEEEEDDIQAHVIKYTLTLTPCPLATEIAILRLLDTDGHLYYSTFHEEREPCVYRRPVSDLIQIWHPEKVEGGVFCLHVSKRGRRISEAEVQAVEKRWKAKVVDMFGIDLEEMIDHGRSESAIGAQAGNGVVNDIGGEGTKTSSIVEDGPRSKAGSRLEQRAKAQARLHGAGGAGEETTTNRESGDRSEADRISKAEAGSVGSVINEQESTEQSNLAYVGAVQGIDKLQFEEFGGSKVVRSTNRKAEGRPKVAGWRGTATEVTLSLRFVVDGTPLNALIWQPITDILVPSTTRTQDLPSHLAPFMRKLITADQALMADMQEKVYWLTIILKPYLGDERDTYLDFTRGWVPVENICDFLRDPDDHQESIAMSVAFRGISLDKAISTVDEAIHPCESTTRHVCLGTIRDRLMYQARSDRIPTTVAIIGSMDMEDQATMSLSLIPVFLLQSLVIGDALAGDPLAFRADFDWRNNFAGVKSAEELLVRMREHVDDVGATDELPTAPSYCFHQFAGFGRLAKWPKDGVQITVCYIRLFATEDTIEVSMPTQQYFRLLSAGTPTSVHSLILDRMAETPAGQIMFSGEVVKKWKMVMFVLPQIEDMAKMYLWEEGSIVQFLSPDGDGMDGRLLMEAHFVAR